MAAAYYFLIVLNILASNVSTLFFSSYNKKWRISNFYKVLSEPGFPKKATRSGSGRSGSFADQLPTCLKFLFCSTGETNPEGLEKTVESYKELTDACTTQSCQSFEFRLLLDLVESFELGKGVIKDNECRHRFPCRYPVLNPPRLPKKSKRVRKYPEILLLAWLIIKYFLSPSGHVAVMKPYAQWSISFVRPSNLAAIFARISSWEVAATNVPMLAASAFLPGLDAILQPIKSMPKPFWVEAPRQNSTQINEVT